MNEARTAQRWNKRISRDKERLQTEHRGGILDCTGLIHVAQLYGG